MEYSVPQPLFQYYAAFSQGSGAYNKANNKAIGLTSGATVHVDQGVTPWLHLLTPPASHASTPFSPPSIDEQRGHVEDDDDLPSPGYLDSSLESDFEEELCFSCSQDNEDDVPTDELSLLRVNCEPVDSPTIWSSGGSSTRDAESWHYCAFPQLAFDRDDILDDLFSIKYERAAAAASEGSKQHKLVARAKKEGGIAFRMATPPAHVASLRQAGAPPQNVSSAAVHAAYLPDAGCELAGEAAGDTRLEESMNLHVKYLEGMIDEYDVD